MHMSSPQNIPPPKTARAKHQHSKSASQLDPNTNANPAQKRPRGNRKKHANNGNTQSNNGQAGISANQLPVPQDAAFADSAVFSSEDVHISAGVRHMKKHTHSQPASDRILPSNSINNASLTDSEVLPNNPSATPAKAQGAYAGPTFHASPAPSALPIPKFFSRSVPAKTRTGPPTPPEDDSDSAGSPTPSPSSPSRMPIPVPPRSENSPLDILFKADREEKARNVHGSPTSLAFSNSPQQSSTNRRPGHFRQHSQSSTNTVFPIELEAESRGPVKSPPLASPVAHRSTTAPSKIPQLQDVRPSNNEVMQDLLDRLTLSQKKSSDMTPPRTVDRIPSEPSSRHQSPSPFYDDGSAHRSASGPTTPAPISREGPDFFYGNRNLSPLFKAAQSDYNKRNSGLRTEITADSPVLSQSEFPSATGATSTEAAAVSRDFLQNIVAPSEPRRGSVPHIQHIPPYKERPNMYTPRTPGRRSYHSRPDSYPNQFQNGSPNSKPPTVPKPTTMSFVPSSVSAKRHSTTASATSSRPATSGPDPPATSTESQSDPRLDDLKRLLNLQVGGNLGVR